METQTERMNTYEMFNLQYIDYTPRLLHQDSQKEFSPLDVSVPQQLQTHISPDLLTFDVIQQPVTVSQLSFSQDPLDDSVLLSNVPMQWQPEMSSQPKQFENKDPYGKYRDPFTDFGGQLMKLESSNDITSSFPRISTDLTHEEKRRPAPLNLVDVLFYPTPDSSTFPQGFKQHEVALHTPVLQDITLHSPLSAKSETFKLRNNSINFVNSPIASSNSRVSKATGKNRFKSVPTIPKIARTGSHTTQPGPIPASKPTVRIDPETGDELLTFSYSKQKIINTFTIKCPVSPININDMSEQFLLENCVYPRAMVPVEEYKGNRGKYERECNEIGWTLAWYNPEIRNHRGLVQRAVDSWRNTRSDKNLRSRRVRKAGDQAK